jgi:hypothetical protein
MIFARMSAVNRKKHLIALLQSLADLDMRNL